MNGWKNAKLAELLINYDSKRIPLSSLERVKRKGIYPYYGATSVLDYVNDYLFDGEYILLGEDGTVVTPDGKPVLQLVVGKFWVNNHAHVLRNTEKVDFKFLYYLLKNMPITSAVTGAVQPKISQKNLYALEVLYPENIDHQQKIAAVLSALDSKIELNTKINNNLEQQAQALLARYNTDVQTRCKLGDLLRFVNGFAFKSSEYLANGIYKVITIKNVQDGKVDSQSASCIDELPAKMPTECTLKIGDVLLSLTGNVGRVGIVCEENLLLNQRVAKVCAKNPEYNAFLYFVMRQSQLKTEMENISRGTAQQNLSPVEALNLEINFNEEMTNKLSGVLKSYFDEIIRNTVESSHLAAIRDALLPKLMSGEIDVSKVDISDPSYLDKLLFSEETE